MCCMRCLWFNAFKCWPVTVKSLHMMHMPPTWTSGSFSPPHLEGITLNIPPNSSCRKDREPSLLVKSQKSKHTKIMTNTLNLEALLRQIKCVFLQASVECSGNCVLFLERKWLFSVLTGSTVEGHGASTLKRFFPYKGGQYFSSHLESWPEYKVDEVTLFLKLQKLQNTKFYKSWPTNTPNHSYGNSIMVVLDNLAKKD